MTKHTPNDFLSKLFIDGAWVDSSSGETFAVEDPATGEVLVRIADGNAEDMQRAIDGAHRAQKPWAALTALDRAHIMRRAADIARADIDRLARVLTLEHGKPHAQAVAELNYGLDFIEWFAEEGRRTYGTTIPSTSPDKRIITIRQSAGVSVAITPWNFPAIQILRKLGAALASGCSMVVKPAALTPLSALEIGKFFAEAGLPAGVLQVVPASRASRVSETIMADSRVRVLSFTGSTEVGKILMRDAAPTMKRLALELGGHAPFIVFDDADLDLAVEQLLAVKMRNMGQTCVSANRVYVQRSITEEFTARFVAKLESMRMGHGIEDGVEVGPLIDEAAVVKVEEHVADAIAGGASVATGGRRAGGELAAGHYYVPTVLTGVEDSMLVAREETFGPVAPIFAFDTEEEVVERANNSPYGLAAYFFTRDVNRIVRVSEALEYGVVGANDGSISAVQAPFGGVKESGIGREGGHWGMDEYMDTKYISLAGLSRP